MALPLLITPDVEVPSYDVGVAVSQLLTELLIDDHRRIQNLAEELTADCSRSDASEGSCFSRFRTFKALTAACIKAKEYTLYALVEENGSKGFADARKFVLESYVENDMIDLWLKELGQAEELSDQFRAKLNVVVRMLLKNMKAEEDFLFPDLAKRLSTSQLTDLAVIYTREREDIFAKKSGLRKPAMNMQNRNLLTH